MFGRTSGAPTLNTGFGGGSAGTGLFGSNNTASNTGQQTTSSSPFGASPFGQGQGQAPNQGQQNQQNQSVFGSGGATGQPQSGGTSGLFGSGANNTAQSPFGGGQQQQQQPPGNSSNLFGSGMNNNNSNTQSPFGGGQQQQQQQQNQQGGGGGLFGAGSGSLANNANSSSLFGQSQQQQPQQQQQQSGLFGNSGNNTNAPASGFGAFNKPSGLGTSNFGSGSNTTNTMFGSSLNYNTQNQQQQQQPQQQQQQQQQSQQPQLGNSLFGGQQPGSFAPRERSVLEQMQAVLAKWDPEQQQQCVFQHYFYNTVPADQVPYHAPTANEDPAKWEEALAKRDRPDSVPVLCRGFAELGGRLNLQNTAVQALRQRLHEINSSLNEMLTSHELDISVKCADAKRRHASLTQRCLQLATKVQILRNRGYTLDSAEEALRKRLQQLEHSAFDPKLNARQEEIWARMLQVRERARIVEAELKRRGDAGLAGDGADAKKGAEIDEATMRQARKILGDFEAQILHLHRELASIRSDLEAHERR